jgi:hypothetical protein
MKNTHWGPLASLWQKYTWHCEGGSVWWNGTGQPSFVLLHVTFEKKLILIIMFVCAPSAKMQPVWFWLVSKLSHLLSIHPCKTHVPSGKMKIIQQAKGPTAKRGMRSMLGNKPRCLCRCKCFAVGPLAHAVLFLSFSLCQSGAKGPQCVFFIGGCLTYRWVYKNWETGCNLVLDIYLCYVHTHTLLLSSCWVFSQLQTMTKWSTFEEKQSLVGMFSFYIFDVRIEC